MVILIDTADRADATHGVVHVHRSDDRVQGPDLVEVITGLYWVDDWDRNPDDPTGAGRGMRQEQRTPATLTARARDTLSYVLDAPPEPEERTLLVRVADLAGFTVGPLVDWVVMAVFDNRTPHAVAVLDDAGDTLIAVPASGTAGRLVYSARGTAPFTDEVLVGVEGMPDPRPGVIVLVSRAVAVGLLLLGIDRDDVRFPEGQVYDPQTERIVGCRRLARLRVSA